MLKIQKSMKEKYAEITKENGSKILRKVYTRKDGVNLIVINNIIWAFKYDSQGNGYNIKNLGKRNKNFKPEDLENLKIEEKPEQKEELKQIEKEELKQIEIEGEVKHEKYDQILACIEANIPVYLYGPAGSGKNHTLKQIADELGLDFYFTNSVQQEYKITGFIDASGKYHETEFYKAFKYGGLFFLDEMDASIPEVLVLLNAAIANGYFEFPNGRIDAHKNFRVVAAGNTVGNGADEQYTGRLQLDQATLDRFVLIEFDYDKNIELKLAKGNIELVEFIRGLRKKAEELGIRATFSYRCITMVTKLEGKLELTEIIKIAVTKGMDQDTINTLTDRLNPNKYYKALNKIGA